LNELKKKIKGAKRERVELLDKILYAYRTTQEPFISGTPFLLTYGIVVMIPTKIG
jgi:hypothetical protein